MDWRYGSNGRAPAFQVQIPVPQNQKTNKRALLFNKDLLSIYVASPELGLA
jgi:hypothetical protein